jgi:hypothetical protein
MSSHDAGLFLHTSTFYFVPVARPGTGGFLNGPGTRRILLLPAGF